MRIQDEFVKHMSFQKLTQGRLTLLLKQGCRIFDASVFSLAMFWSFLLISSPNAYATGVTGLVSKVGDATHVEFRGKAQWNYDLEKVGSNKVRVVVPPFDVPTQATLRTWSDSLVQEIKIDKQGKDGKYVLTFTLADSQVESFDYLTDEPSRLIIDFYRPEAPQKPAPNKTVKKSANRKRLKKKSKSKNAGTVKDGDYVKRDKLRKPAGSELLEVKEPRIKKKGSLSIMAGVFDGNDPRFSRFVVKDHEIREEAIIASG